MHVPDANKLIAARLVDQLSELNERIIEDSARLKRTRMLYDFKLDSLKKCDFLMYQEYLAIVNSKKPDEVTNVE